MSIIYYPQITQKRPLTALDNLSKNNNLRTVSGGGDISSTGIDATISYEHDWKLESVAFDFSAATSRDFYLKIKNGKRVVEKVNDIFWIQCKNPGTLWTKITLQSDQGVQSGDELATTLQDELNTNTHLSAAGYSFTVSYADGTGLFTITPSGGQIAFWQESPGGSFNDRISTGGHLYGFTANSGFGSTLVSDTPVFGINDEVSILTYTSSVLSNLYFDDGLILSMDQAVRITSSTAAIVANFTATTREIR